MDAPAELMDRAKELVRSLCARNLIPGASIEPVTTALHDELCGASLAMLAEIALRREHICRGDLETAIRSTGFELMTHLHDRFTAKESEIDEDPVIRTVAIVCERPSKPGGWIKMPATCESPTPGLCLCNYAMSECPVLKYSELREFPDGVYGRTEKKS